MSFWLNPNMYYKDFNKWNQKKQKIEISSKNIYFSEREIWWCSFGVNIGAEIDGKDGKFERPALILSYISKETMLIVPLTSKQRKDVFHVKISTTKMISFAKLSQIRVVSAKRLLRKIDTLSLIQLNFVKEQLSNIYLDNRNPPKGGFLGGRSQQ